MSSVRKKLRDGTVNLEEVQMAPVRLWRIRPSKFAEQGDMTQDILEDVNGEEPASVGMGANGFHKNGKRAETTELNVF